MVSTSQLLLQTLLLLAGLLPTVSLAIPLNKRFPSFPPVIVPQEHYEVIAMRSSVPLDPKSVRDVVCIDPMAHVVFHDLVAAELGICGGVMIAVPSSSSRSRSSSSKRSCDGSVSETTSQKGSALFRLRVEEDGDGDGANINISKDRWMQCVRAAREVCPTGTMRGVCVGGVTRGVGGLVFELVNP